MKSIHHAVFMVVTAGRSVRRRAMRVLMLC
jgi:hypothetical protein